VQEQAHTDLQGAFATGVYNRNINNNVKTEDDLMHISGEPSRVDPPLSAALPFRVQPYLHIAPLSGIGPQPALAYSTFPSAESHRKDSYLPYAQQKGRKIAARYGDEIEQMLIANPNLMPTAAAKELSRRFLHGNIAPNDWPGEKRLKRKVYTEKKRLKKAGII